MPARTSTSTNGTAPKANSKRFELPALEFNFQPLTDGTDIPPPPPSPVKETAPEKPSSGENKENKDAVKKEEGANGTAAIGKKNNGTVIQTTVIAGTKRPADDLSSPLSPALSSRQGSIRRLFSRTLMNNTYVEGEPDAVNGQANGVRPGSRSNTSILDEKKAKRSSGWFRRLRSGNETPNKRSSAILFEEQKKPAGPPPPMIPELSALGNKVDVHDEGSLGADDMFKNIK